MSKCPIFRKKEEREDYQDGNSMRLKYVKNRVIENRIFRDGELQLHINHCENIVISGCTFKGVRSDNGHAILINNSKRIEIKNCEFLDMKTGNSEVLALNGDVKDFHIHRNRFIGATNIMLDCISGEGSGDDLDICSHGIVECNYFDSDGMQRDDYDTALLYCDGGQNIVFRYNTIINSSLGIEVASENEGTAKNIIVLENSLTDISKYAIRYGSYKRRFGGVNGLTIRDNSFENCKNLYDEMHNAKNVVIE